MTAFGVEVLDNEPPKSAGLDAQVFLVAELGKVPGTKHLGPARCGDAILHPRPFYHAGGSQEYHGTLSVARVHASPLRVDRGSLRYAAAMKGKRMHQVFHKWGKWDCRVASKLVCQGMC